jgi:hypothetical protein
MTASKLPPKVHPAALLSLRHLHARLDGMSNSVGCGPFPPSALVRTSELQPPNGTKESLEKAIRKLGEGISTFGKSSAYEALMSASGPDRRFPRNYKSPAVRCKADIGHRPLPARAHPPPAATDACETPSPAHSAPPANCRYLRPSSSAPPHPCRQLDRPEASAVPRLRTGDRDRTGPGHWWHH